MSAKVIQNAGEILGSIKKQITSWQSSRQKTNPSGIFPGFGPDVWLSCRVSKMGMPGSSGMSNITNLGVFGWWILGWFLAAKIAQVLINIQFLGTKDLKRRSQVELHQLQCCSYGAVYHEASHPCGRSNSPPPKRAKMRHATRVTLKAKLSKSGLPAGCAAGWRVWNCAWICACWCWNPFGM